MTKFQFLSELQYRLRGLPDGEIRESLDYYAEMINEHIEEGMYEEYAVAVIGSPKQVADKILSEASLISIIKGRAKNKKLSAWGWALIILSSPIWLALLVSAVAVVISVYAVFWSVWVSLFASAVAICACSLAGGVLAGISFWQANSGAGIFFSGATAILLGLGVLAICGCLYLVKSILWISKKTWRMIKALFVEKED